jgi:hypothetical protein
MLWQHLESGASQPLGTHRWLENPSHENLVQYPVESYTQNEVKNQIRRRFKLKGYLFDQCIANLSWVWIGGVEVGDSLGAGSLILIH